MKVKNIVVITVLVAISVLLLNSSVITKYHTVSEEKSTADDKTPSTPPKQLLKYSPTEKPWHSDRNAGHSDRKPGHSDRKPGHADRKAGHSDRKAGHSDREPGHSDREPGHLDREPGHLDRKPGHSDEFGVTLTGDEMADNDLVRVAKTISKDRNRVLVTMVNNAYLSFTYSWLCNTKHMEGVHKSVLIITTDKLSKEKLKRDWPEINVVAMDVGKLDGDQTYSHAGYVKIMVKRTEMLLSILLADIEILLFEVDCVWFGNLIPELEEYSDVDVLVNPVATTTDVFAGGLLYLYPTDKGKALWKEVTEKMLALGMMIATLPDNRAISEGENDQRYFSKLVMERYGGVRVKLLPLKTYADGKWYTLSEEQRNKTHPILINNNWVVGNKGKIERAKKWHHWFIKEDMSCDLELVRKTVY